MLKATVDFNNKTAETGISISKAISRAVTRSLAVMEGNIKKNTPIRTGTLARSITAKETGFGKGEVYTKPIDEGKEITYAVHVEYGTIHQAPRGMFRKGVAQSEQRIEQIFDEELAKVVK